MTALARHLRPGVHALLLWAGAAVAQPAPDPHDLFESRCLSCHGHAGSFARDHLRLGEEGIVTSRGLPLAPFLETHRGGLPAAAVAPLLAMFRQQLSTDALYQTTCRFCHDRARDFALRNLILRDGQLTGRYSGHVIADFLAGHARLTADEARMMTAILRGFLDARP
jgi:cytochrome c5